MTGLPSVALAKEGFPWNPRVRGGKHERLFFPIETLFLLLDPRFKLRGQAWNAPSSFLERHCLTY